MTSIHFQSGVRKANKKIDRLLRKKDAIVHRRLESLQNKATKRYYQAIGKMTKADLQFINQYRKNLARRIRDAQGVSQLLLWAPRSGCRVRFGGH